MTPLFQTYRRALILVLAVVFLPGCDNTIEPLLEDDSINFAVYGYLDMRESRQIVRVEALRETILQGSGLPEGIEVSTIDESDQTFQFWRDSLITLDDGTLGAAFVADFTPELGHTYSLLITRNGVTESRATTSLPIEVPVSTTPPAGNGFNYVQRLVLSGLTDQPENVYMDYLVSPPFDGPPETVSVAYGNPGFETQNGWELDINLAVDKAIIQNHFGIDDDDGNIILHRASMRSTLLSEEWRFPAAEANLESAHGFFGSVGVLDYRLVLDPTTIATLSYTDNQSNN